MIAKLAHITTRRASISAATVFTARIRLYVPAVDSAGRPTLAYAGAFTGIGDNRTEAEQDALRWCREQMAREGRDMPTVENIGKVTRLAFDKQSFG